MKNNTKDVVLEFKLPEFKREEIKIKLTSNSAIIRAFKRTNNEIKKKDFFHKESYQNAFNYITNLPYVDHKNAKIDFKKGILRISIPKK